MHHSLAIALAWLLLFTASNTQAADATPAATPATFDAALASRTGADDYGMRRYVLVILKSGPNRVPDGPKREAMFKGHFANMNRLADAGVLAVAGPLDGVDGWRGLFILAVDDIEEAKAHVATDPVIVEGEMVAEYHKHHGSAALMLINELHKTVAKKSY